VRILLEYRVIIQVVETEFKQRSSKMSDREIENFRSGQPEPAKQQTAENLLQDTTDHSAVYCTQNVKPIVPGYWITQHKLYENGKSGDDWFAMRNHPSFIGDDSYEIKLDGNLYEEVMEHPGSPSDGYAGKVIKNGDSPRPLPERSKEYEKVVDAISHLDFSICKWE
jgi:hypothetical protein